MYTGATRIKLEILGVIIKSVRKILFSEIQLDYKYQQGDIDRAINCLDKANKYLERF